MKKTVIRQLHKMRRAAALAVCLLIIAGLVAPLWAVKTDAADYEAGGDLIVRVGYFGEDEDYRTKAVLTREELEDLAIEEMAELYPDEPDHLYYFSNVTRVGTVMETVGWGPTIIGVLEKAGLDPASVQTINLRTTDGSHVNNWFVSLNMDQWVNTTRYYYPYLRGDYERVEIEDGASIGDEGGMAEGYVVPGKRALRGNQKVPSILAIESYATKDPTEEIDPGLISDKVSYRFCCGQTRMVREEPCSDYSSMNSAQYIFGIDCTLYGSPGEVTDIELDFDDSDLVVGSQKQINGQVIGEEFFPGMGYANITWSSSDPSIADVDQNGLVTFLKKGEVTITATAGGVSKSVTFKVVGKDDKDSQGDDEKDKDPSGGGKKDDGKKDSGNKDNGKSGGNQADNSSKQSGGSSRQHYSSGSYGRQRVSNAYTPKSYRKMTSSNDRKKAKRQTKKRQVREDTAPDQNAQAKELTVGMREVVLEDTMYEREEMSEKATPLDARKTTTPHAGIYTLAGISGCAAAGGLARFLWFLKEVH